MAEHEISRILASTTNMFQIEKFMHFQAKLIECAIQDHDSGNQTKRSFLKDWPLPLTRSNQGTKWKFWRREVDVRDGAEWAKGTKPFSEWKFPTQPPSLHLLCYLSCEHSQVFGARFQDQDFKIFEKKGSQWWGGVKYRFQLLKTTLIFWWRGFP